MAVTVLGKGVTTKDSNGVPIWAPSTFNCWITSVYDSAEAYLVLNNGGFGVFANMMGYGLIIKPGGSSWQRIMFPRSAQTSLGVKLAEMDPVTFAVALSADKKTVNNYFDSKFGAITHFGISLAVEYEFTDTVRCR